MVAERSAADRIGGDRAQHDQPERLRLEVAQDQLQRKEHTRDRRIERRRDPARSTARDKQPQLRLPQPEQLAGHRADRRADLHDRSLPPDRPARTDANRRGERFDDRDLRADPTAHTVDREHHLWHAVPSRLGREPRDQRTVDQPADDRREHHEPDPQPGHQRVIGVADGAVVTMPGEHVREPEDHVPKRDRPQPGADADQQRQRHQPTRATGHRTR